MSSVALPLACKRLGSPTKPAVVLLHGLLGSSRNWTTAARVLAEYAEVFIPDARNHGASPHSPVMDYPAMVADLLALLERTVQRPAIIVGHSMGGKTAMLAACHHPLWVRALVVVDLAPHPYAPRWQREFAAMRALDVANVRSRAEAETVLAADISDWAFRKFVVTNLERDDATGGFRWIVNLPLLQESLVHLFAKPLTGDDTFAGPTRFIRGARSRFLVEEDMPEILCHFPSASLVAVPDAGHNVHFDNLPGFLAAWQDFLPNESLRVPPAPPPFAAP